MMMMLNGFEIILLKKVFCWFHFCSVYVPVSCIHSFSDLSRWKGLAAAAVVRARAGLRAPEKRENSREVVRRRLSRVRLGLGGWPGCGRAHRQAASFDGLVVARNWLVDGCLLFCLSLSLSLWLTWMERLDLNWDFLVRSGLFDYLSWGPIDLEGCLRLLVLGFGFLLLALTLHLDRKFQGYSQVVVVGVGGQNVGLLSDRFLSHHFELDGLRLSLDGPDSHGPLVAAGLDEVRVLRSHVNDGLRRCGGRCWGRCRSQSCWGWRRSCLFGDRFKQGPAEVVPQVVRHFLDAQVVELLLREVSLLVGRRLLHLHLQSRLVLKIVLDSFRDRQVVVRSAEDGAVVWYDLLFPGPWPSLVRIGWPHGLGADRSEGPHQSGLDVVREENQWPPGTLGRAAMVQCLGVARLVGLKRLWLLVDERPLGRSHDAELFVLQSVGEVRLPNSVGWIVWNVVKQCYGAALNSMSAKQCSKNKRCKVLTYRE